MSVAVERANEVVFRSVAGEILRGELSPGAALPAERSLAERFDVSKVVIRQALYQLEELELIAVRQGRPSVVLDPEDALDMRVMVLSAELSGRSHGEMKDFAETVMLHVGNLLELAEPRATDAEIDVLESILAEYEACGTEEVFHDVEERFWTEMARSTHNRVLLKQTRWWFRFMRRSRQLGTDGGGRVGRTMSAPQTRFALFRGVFDVMKNKGGAAAAYRSLAMAAIAQNPNLNRA